MKLLTAFGRRSREAGLEAWDQAKIERKSQSDQEDGEFDTAGSFGRNYRFSTADSYPVIIFPEREEQSLSS